ncbi:hypothetical protein DPMN_048379 [Dreissena polymorpha]|uniref:Uncharacterized protein n=1 Tax=Dreissena polymorpha TaxID=45954 RepID=A0A9D4I2V0_DREPO|nr:hypothetical protein DPMN_048377 [Dreissena polymorpha]KAH3741654.1 hypothetical protein DPMN_048379 [Dreissena polymorpha]
MNCHGVITRLRRLWTSIKSIRSPNKYRFYTSLVVSILLYDSEALSLRLDTQRRIQAFEHKCLRRLLRNMQHMLAHTSP